MRDVSDVQKIMELWRLQRAVNFGCVDAKLRPGQSSSTITLQTWQKGRLSEFIIDSKVKVKDLSRNIDELDTSQWPVTGTTRGYMAWLCAMYQIIQADSERFAGREVEKVLADIASEDWNRAYEMLRYYHRIHSASGARGGVDEGSALLNDDGSSPQPCMGLLTRG